MKSRQEAALALVKFNKFIKDLTYNVCILGDIKLTSYAEELLNFESWARSIKEYVESTPDPLFLDQILSLGSTNMLEEYLRDSKDSITVNTYHGISCIVKAVHSLRDQYNNINEESKGKYRYLVNEFANEEAAALFNRVVSAGYLTAEYQPKGDTTIHTLKLIAFAIGQCLHLTTRHKWVHFEDQWGITKSNKLSQLPITKTQFRQSERLMRLFPEVDFTTFEDPQEDIFFDAAYGERRVRTLHKDLVDHQYISSDTKVEDFLAIFNIGDNPTKAPINWIKNQRQLSYFIYHTLSSTNRDYWSKTTANFVIKGVTPNKESLKTGLVLLQKTSNYQRYDTKLRQIASRYIFGQ